MVVQLSDIKTLYHMVGIYEGYYMCPIMYFASLGTFDKCYVAGIGYIIEVRVGNTRDRVYTYGGSSNNILPPSYNNLTSYILFKM